MAQSVQDVARAYGFPEDRGDQYVCLMQGKPFILTGGLQYLMDQRWEDEYTVKAVLPTVEEYDLVRRMQGIGEQEGFVVFKGVVTVSDGKTFEDFGTASPRNMRGFVKFEDHGVHMASRRATNRAMRLACNVGLTSVDELDGSNGPTEDRKTTQVSMPSRVLPPVEEEDPQVVALKQKLSEAHADGYLTSTEHERAVAFISGAGVTEAMIRLTEERLDKKVDEVEKQAEVEGKQME